MTQTRDYFYVFYENHTPTKLLPMTLPPMFVNVVLPELIAALFYSFIISRRPMLSNQYWTTFSYENIVDLAHSNNVKMDTFDVWPISQFVFELQQ